MPRPASVQVGGLDSTPDQGGLFPGLSGTSYTYTFAEFEADVDLTRLTQGAEAFGELPRAAG